jgi:hypothetical protein
MTQVLPRNGDLAEHRPWAPAELDEAIALRRARWSARAIGRKLNRSRNSVIGALWRAAEPRLLANQFDDRGLPMRFTERGQW